MTRAQDCCGLSCPLSGTARPIEYVWATFQAQVLDTESAAVAHVAYANGVPFLTVRSLSDLAGGDRGANEMMTFMALASRNSATVVKAIVGEMP